MEGPSRKRLCLDADAVTGNGDAELDLQISNQNEVVEEMPSASGKLIKDSEEVENVKIIEEDDDEGVERIEIVERNPIDVGITEYLGQHRGFFGIVKNRWEDFHVHEISMDEKEVRLTSVDLPKGSQPTKPDDNNELTDEMREKLEQVANGDIPHLKIPAPDDKAKRTQIHTSVKRHFPSLNSNTEVESGGEKVITVTLKKAAKGPARSDNPKRTCQFVLHKKGRDTSSAISVLCGLLKTHPKRVSFAGNKDRRGVTSQLVTAYQVSAERLRDLNPTLRNMKVGNFQYVKRSLQLGDLKGNSFTIAIREVKGEESDICEAMQSLKEHGFINYFGLQRFGTALIPSYEIGLAIIRSQWEKAIDLIMEPQPTDLPQVRKLKMGFKENGDATAALPGMSDHVSRSLLHGIARHGKTLKAIMELPRQLRQLYIHSTQSLLWNRLVSRRVREIGVRVQPGDLYIRKECLNHRIKTQNAVVEVTEDKMAGLSIYDLVVPLPGYDVTFGNGHLRRWYLELLAELGLTEEEFKHEIKDFSAAGTYRAMFVRPKDVSFHTRFYDDHELPVILSDWDLLTDPSRTKLPPSIEGKQKAVVVNFTLPKSCYATIAIREVMRTVKIKA